MRKTLPSPPSGLWERQHTRLLIITTALFKPKVEISQEIQNKQSAPLAPACIFEETIKEATSPGQPQEAVLKAPAQLQCLLSTHDIRDAVVYCIKQG